MRYLQLINNKLQFIMLHENKKSSKGKRENVGGAQFIDSWMYSLISLSLGVPFNKSVRK